MSAFPADSELSLKLHPIASIGNLGTLGVRWNEKSPEALEDFDSHRHDSQMQRHDGICSFIIVGIPRLPIPALKYFLSLLPSSCIKGYVGTWKEERRSWAITKSYLDAPRWGKDMKCNNLKGTLQINKNTVFLPAMMTALLSELRFLFNQNQCIN